MNDLCTRIEKLSKKANTLYKIQHKKDNLEAIKLLDSKYKFQVEQLTKLIEIICYIKSEFEFTPSKQLSENINDSIQNAKNSIYDSELSEDYVENLINSNKESNNKIKKEWKSFYENKFTPILKILDIAKNVKTTEVIKYQEIIKKSEKFDNNIVSFKNLKSTIDQANELIYSLDLDDQVKLFLKKIISGRATVLDLKDEKIFKWIESHDLSSNIRLSFINK